MLVDVTGGLGGVALDLLVGAAVICLASGTTLRGDFDQCSLAGWRRRWAAFTSFVVLDRPRDEDPDADRHKPGAPSGRRRSGLRRHPR